MLPQNNFHSAMQVFSNLNEAERKLFLSVVAPNSTAKTPTRKTRKTVQLPEYYSEEAIYQRMIASWNEKVRKRNARRNLKESNKKI
ncbi:conserved protein of unknown function [Tenacibaculum sp. 190130A14a]|uniref:Uncharacterized protein n=1 Tax=Tenacibaculum polynesiense TaxID=3137857 RepID=A0ABM9P6Z8_9FLAO